MCIGGKAFQFAHYPKLRLGPQSYMRFLREPNIGDSRSKAAMT